MHQSLSKVPAHTNSPAMQIPRGRPETSTVTRQPQPYDSRHVDPEVCDSLARTSDSLKLPSTYSNKHDDDKLFQNYLIKTHCTASHGLCNYIITVDYMFTAAVDRPIAFCQQSLRQSGLRVVYCYKHASLSLLDLASVTYIKPGFQINLCP